MTKALGNALGDFIGVIGFVFVLALAILLATVFQLFPRLAPWEVQEETGEAIGRKIIGFIFSVALIFWFLWMLLVVLILALALLAGLARVVAWVF